MEKVHGARGICIVVRRYPFRKSSGHASLYYTTEINLRETSTLWMIFDDTTMAVSDLSLTTVMTYRDAIAVAETVHRGYLGDASGTRLIGSVDNTEGRYDATQLVILSLLQSPDVQTPATVLAADALSSGRGARRGCGQASPRTAPPPR